MTGCRMAGWAPTTTWLAVVLVGFLVSCGCGGPKTDAKPDAQNSPAASAPAPMAAPPAPGGDLGVAGAFGNAATPAVAPGAVPPAVNAPPPLPPGAVPAQVGVGVKGRSLDQFQGAVVTPAKTLFAAKERVVFDIQIPQALQLYKATNGQGPPSHEAFMQSIVAENSIQLPQLPAGRSYQYDPQTEQLMVVPTPSP